MTTPASPQHRQPRPSRESIAEYNELLQDAAIAATFQCMDKDFVPSRAPPPAPPPTYAASAHHVGYAGLAGR